MPVKSESESHLGEKAAKPCQPSPRKVVSSLFAGGQQSSEDPSPLRSMSVRRALTRCPTPLPRPPPSVPTSMDRPSTRSLGGCRARPAQGRGPGRGPRIGAAAVAPLRACGSGHASGSLHQEDTKLEEGPRNHTSSPGPGRDEREGAGVGGMQGILEGTHVVAELSRRQGSGSQRPDLGPPVIDSCFPRPKVGHVIRKGV